MDTPNQIVDKIAAGTGMSRDEILAKIREEREELHEFVTLEGAASIVAHRLGVMLDFQETSGNQVSRSTKNQNGGVKMEVFDEIEKELEKAQPTRPNWEPKEGDTLVGQIARIDHIKTEKIDNDLMVIKPSDGSEEVTVWKSQLVRELFEKAKLGDNVGLKYLGKLKSDAGRTYKNIKWVLKPAQR